MRVAFYGSVFLNSFGAVEPLPNIANSVDHLPKIVSTEYRVTEVQMWVKSCFFYHVVVVET